MSDLNRVGDLEVKIVGVDGITPVDTISVGSSQALAVDIAGSAGTAATLSIANVIKYNSVASLSGYTTVTNTTVPTGKTWYLKGMVLSSSAFAQFRISIDSVITFECRSDADDVNEVTLHGFQVNAGSTILIEANAGGVGKTLISNLIIYEE